MNDEEWQEWIDEILNEFEQLERVGAKYDRRWDQVRESTRGDCPYVRVEDLQEILSRYKSMDFVAQQSIKDQEQK